MRCRYGAEETESYFSNATMGGMAADPCIFIQSAVNISDVELRARGRWRIHSKLGNGCVSELCVNMKMLIVLQVQHKVCIPFRPPPPPPPSHDMIQPLFSLLQPPSGRNSQQRLRVLPGTRQRRPRGDELWRRWCKRYYVYNI
jgi:hypothetical protein